MAILQNSLSQQIQAKTNKNKEIEQEIDKLNEDIRRLKIEFDIYFNGGKKTPPHQSRASLEAKIKRLNGNRGLPYSQRYKLNGIVAKYTSYRELWRRKLKERGDDLI